jgi:hypothetical protein
MITRIPSAYPRHATCITLHTDEAFHVYDPPQRLPTDPALPCARRVGSPELTDLAVLNPGSQVVHLVAIDKYLYSSADTTRCDCALVCDEQIHFIEFKHGVSKRRTDRVKECIPQLAAAINDFYKAGILLPNTTVQAIACVGFTEEFPPRTASLDARILQLNRLVEVDIIVELQVTDTTIFN